MAQTVPREQEPILREPLQVDFIVDMKDQKEWDQHLLACCGDCGLLGCATFALVKSCPCLAMGHNAQRAYRGSLWLHAIVYFVLFVLFSVILVVVIEATELSCIVKMQQAPSGVTFENDSVGLRKDCLSAVGRNAGVCLYFGLAFSTFGVIYAARNRTIIRQRFGIAGSRMGDLCTWLWCGSCALCQETRTLWANNVYNGRWYGRAPLPSTPCGTATPPQQLIMVMPADIRV